MSNIVYNLGLSKWLDPSSGPGVGTWKWLLESSTSTYSPNKDHDSILDQAGFVEISVESYVRQTLGTPLWSEVDDSDLAKFDCDDVDFGDLEAGETVQSIILALQSSETCIPFLRIDTDANSSLPRELDGTRFVITIQASGLLTIAQV